MNDLELDLGILCNNRCIFCTIPHSHESRPHWLPIEQAKKDLAHFYSKGCRSLGFVGGEPTIYPDLPDCIRFAKSLGYKRIDLCSNGTKFSDHKFVSGLIKAGVTRFTISIHSHIPEIEDSITGVPGNFDRKLDGIRFLVKERKSGRIPDNIFLNPLLFRKTLPHAKKYMSFFSNLDISDIRFNYIWPKARLKNDKDMIPSYTEAMPGILRVILLNESVLKLKLSFGDIPCCMLKLSKKRLSTKLFNYLARKYFAEADNLPTETRTYRAGISPKKVISTELFDYLARKYSAEADDLPAETRTRKAGVSLKKVKKKMFKILGTNCAKCKFYSTCDGIWKSYAAMHGTDEMEPII